MIKKVFSLAKVVRSGCSFNGIISSCNSIFLFFSLVWFENKQMDRLFSFIGEISYYTSASLMQVALASKINALLWKYLFICFSFIHIFFIDVSHTHTHTYIYALQVRIVLWRNLPKNYLLICLFLRKWSILTCLRRALLFYFVLLCFDSLFHT